MEVKILEPKVDLIDVSPKNCDEIISTFAMATTSAGGPLDLFRKAKESGEIEKYVKIISDAINRGYASISTTPTVHLSFSGSRVLDFVLTAIPFGSYMVRSQRFVPPDKILIPREIYNNREAKIIFERIIEEQLKLFNKALKENIPLQEARRIIGFCFPSHAILEYSIESIAVLIKRVYLEKENLIPTELFDFIKRVDEILRNSDAKNVYKACLNSPTLNFDFPLIFKEEKIEAPLELKLLGEFLFKDSLSEFEKEFERILGNPPKSYGEFRKNCFRLSLISQKIAKDYIIYLSFPCSVACFNELKRHRTVPIKVESIYSAIEDWENRIYVPPSFNEDILKEYKKIFEESVNSYYKLLDLGIKEGDAVHVIPQGIILKSIIVLDLAQLLSPFLFYRIRSCSTAEVEIRNLVRRIPEVILKESKYKEFAQKLYNLLVYKNVPLSKCVAGVCPEPRWRKCEIIKVIFPNYDHRAIEKSRKEFKFSL